MPKNLLREAPEYANMGVSDAAAITPDDDADIGVTSAIYVGGTGNLKVTLRSGAAVTFVDIAAGSIVPLYATRVWATGTTATELLALYQ